MPGKEFTMDFRLGASAGGNFNSTFQQAQKKISDLQRDIAALNKSQGDITAYQKQQQAVDATNKKLELLKTQYDNIQKEISETGQYSSQLENKLASKRHEIEKTSQKLEQETQKLDRMGTALRQAGVDTNDLTGSSARLRGEMERLAKEQERVADEANEAAQAQVTSIESVGSALAAAGITAGLKKIYDMYSEFVRVAADFEESMSTVAALSGASADQMGLLSDKAKELGATTKFTAKESADAMGFMAMAGWSTEDMLAGMDGVMQLAAASGEDLALVSDIVTDSMTAFGLTAEDATHYADVLAATATNANTNVAVMGETFKYAAPVAGALGYTIEDVSRAVGLMANAGVKGSNAGTALRNVFNGLLTGVTLTGEAFGEMEYTAVKSDGTMKDFGETIDELRGYFEKMTDAERVQNAIALAGQRGYSGLLAILNATQADYDKLTESIENADGAAKRMADTRLDNLNGQVTLMNSALDAVKTTIGEQFTPVLKDAASGAASLLSEFNGFLKNNPAFIKAGTAAIGTIGGITAAISGFSAAAKIAKTIKTAEIFAPLAAAMPYVAAAGAIAAAVYTVAQAYDEAIDSAWELTEASRAYDGVHKEAAESYENTQRATLATVDVADIYIDRLEEIERETGGAVEGNEEYKQILELLVRTVPELSGLINTETGEIEGGTEALRENTDAWRDNALERAKQEYIASMQDAYNDVLLENANNTRELTGVTTELNAKQAEYAENLKEINSLPVGDERRGQLEAENQVLYNEVLHLKEQQAQLEAALKKGDEAVAEAQKNMLEAAEFAEEYYSQYEEKTQAAVDAESEAVGEMDMSAEAGAAIGSTMQGAITETDRKTPQLAAAAIRAGRAWMAAFGSATSGSPTMNMPIPGFAEGTPSAPPGLAVVGEEGPELVSFRGGEQVVPADPTDRLLRAMDGGGSPVSVSVTFNVTGADAATVGQLEQYGETFAERVRAAVAEAMEDSRRRAYA